MGLALGHDLLTLTLKPAHNHNPNYNNVTYFHVLQTRIRTYDRSRPRVILKSAISAYSAIDRYQAPLPALNRPPQMLKKLQSYHLNNYHYP